MSGSRPAYRASSAPTDEFVTDPNSGPVAVRWSEHHQRPACTVTSDDCEGYVDYLVYLVGPCAGYECAGHPACEDHARAFRRGARRMKAERITSIPRARLGA